MAGHAHHARLLTSDVQLDGGITKNGRIATCLALRESSGCRSESGGGHLAAKEL